MSRRTATLAFAGAILVVLVAVAALLPVPFVVYSPGPMANALGDDVISVDGAETFETDGVLNLTTVGVTPADARVDLLSALRAWVDPERAIVPRDRVYGPDDTSESIREENAQFMQRSQETAKVAALREVGYDVPETVVIERVLNGSPADGTLEPGDVVEEVDGEPVTTPQDVVNAVQAHEPGETVEVAVNRGGESLTLTVDSVESDEGHAQVGAGVAIGYDLPVQVDVNIPERIGGPSAGMIFALAIYDTLTPGAMLEGLRVAGTGEINGDGEVGPIGGIEQKIAAAADDDIEMFLAPASNCDDVAGAENGDMRVVSIGTLDDAIEAVEAIANGDVSSLPRCAVS
jgi:PDZ domain-containing protein